MGARVQQIKGLVQEIGDTSVAAIKQRLRDGLEGRTQAWLSEKTGYEANDIQRWLSEKGNRPPVDFVATYCVATDLSADWVLLGVGPRKHFPPGEAQEALAQIINSIPAHLIQIAKRPE